MCGDYVTSLRTERIMVPGTAVVWKLQYVVWIFIQTKYSASEWNHLLRINRWFLLVGRYSLIALPLPGRCQRRTGYFVTVSIRNVEHECRLVDDQHNRAICGVHM